MCYIHIEPVNYELHTCICNTSVMLDFAVLRKMKNRNGAILLILFYAVFSFL